MGNPPPPQSCSHFQILLSFTALILFIHYCGRSFKPMFNRKDCFWSSMIRSLLIILPIKQAQTAASSTATCTGAVNGMDVVAAFTDSGVGWKCIFRSLWWLPQLWFDFGSFLSDHNFADDILNWIIADNTIESKFFKDFLTKMGKSLKDLTTEVSNKLAAGEYKLDGLQLSDFCAVFSKNISLAIFEASQTFTTPLCFATNAPARSYRD